MKIVLFEDNPDRARQLQGAIQAHLGDQGSVEVFAADSRERVTYDAQIQEAMIRAPYSNATLIVADRDLSAMVNYFGLSESIVGRVADDLGIPECVYTSVPAEERVLLTAAFEKESVIAVSLTRGMQSCASQIVAIADGFRTLARGLETSAHGGTQSAAQTLARVLGRPEYEAKIAQYAAGDQNRRGQISGFSQLEDTERIGRLTCFFGYWLWDSILRYPGVVVNAVAAASYLNLESGAFAEGSDVLSLFESAVYKGPFAAAIEPLWWRGMLDDLVAESGCADGNEYVRNRLGRAVPASCCCEDESIPAGFYCMVSKRPVSAKNSRPGLAWFPRGADLARVSRSKFDELGPWI